MPGCSCPAEGPLSRLAWSWKAVPVLLLGPPGAGTGGGLSTGQLESLKGGERGTPAWGLW